MADTKISADPDAGEVQDGDFVPLVRPGENYKVDPRKIAASGRGIPLDDSDDGATALSGYSYLADTTADSFTLNVPDDGEAGMWFEIIDAEDTFADNPLTIGKNGQTVHGVDEDMTISTPGAAVTFMHNGTTWKIKGAPLE